MLKLVIGTALAVLLVSSATASVNAVQQFCGDRYGACAGPSDINIKFRIRGRKHPRIASHHRHHVSRKQISSRVPGTNKARGLDAVIAPLADKARSIVAACGSTVISAYRPGARVAGSGRPSLHSAYPARAVDIVGNPVCIYSHLRNWPGGYSTDYGAVRHVHISYEPRGREWGARFAHYGHSHRHRYARRHYRYALVR